MGCSVQVMKQGESCGLRKKKGLGILAYILHPGRSVVAGAQEGAVSANWGSVNLSTSPMFFIRSENLDNLNQVTSVQLIRILVIVRTC